VEGADVVGGATPDTSSSVRVSTYPVECRALKDAIIDGDLLMLAP
jgi:hypothetical protein